MKSDRSSFDHLSMASTASFAMCYVACGAMIGSTVEHYFGEPARAIITLVFLMSFGIMLIITRAHRRRMAMEIEINDRVAAQAKEIYDKVEADMDRFIAAGRSQVAPTSIMGRVLMEPAEGYDLMTSGHITVEVKEMGADGRWVDIASPGMVAAMIDRLAQELRQIALNAAAEDSDE